MRGTRRPPTEPPAEARRGRCPRPLHAVAGIILDECGLCGNTGWIVIRAWTDRDREQLVELWTAGMSASGIANRLDRPVNDVFQEAARLGLPDRDRDVNSFVVTVEPFTGTPWAKGLAE